MQSGLKVGDVIQEENVSDLVQGDILEFPGLGEYMEALEEDGDLGACFRQEVGSKIRVVLYKDVDSSTSLLELVRAGNAIYSEVVYKSALVGRTVYVGNTRSLGREGNVPADIGTPKTTEFRETGLSITILGKSYEIREISGGLLLKELEE